MNGYERVKAAIAGRKGDFRPVMLQNFQCGVYEGNITFDQFRRDARLAAECYIKNAEKYDLDGIIIDFDTAMSAGACGCEVVFPIDKPAVTIRGVLEDIEDVDKLVPVKLENSPRIIHCLETSRYVAEYFGNEKYVECGCDQAPFSLASMLRDSQQLMMDLADGEYEDEIFRLLEYSYEIAAQFVKLASQTGAHCIANGDSVAGPDMISPEMYKKYAMPFERQIIDAAHQCGKDYKLHVCGNTTKILEEFVQMPMDIVELDYKTDVQKMHDVLSDKLTVSGNLDPNSVFHRGGPSDVRNAVRRLLDIYKDSYYLIPCSGCCLAPDTPEENVRAFIDEVRQDR